MTQSTLEVPRPLFSEDFEEQDIWAELGDGIVLAEINRAWDDYHATMSVDAYNRRALEVVRVWVEPLGWRHRVLEGNHVLAQSPCRDELQEMYPQAVISGRVICGDQQYYESRDR